MNHFSRNIDTKDNMVGKRILIVDDEENTLHLLKILFEKQGYHIFTIQDGIDINRKIKDIEPDLIILVIIMPKINGLEILKEIKRCNEISMIPVIILTSYRDSDMKLNVLKAGALDYISKPFQKDELLYRVQNIFNYYSKYKEQGKSENSIINKLFPGKDDILIPQIDKKSQYGYIYPKAIAEQS